MSVKYLNPVPTKHRKLNEWVEEWARICKPDGIYWCDGTPEEYQRLKEEAIESGVAIRLNEEKRPNSVLYRSDPSDVARVEKNTYIASEKEEDAGPTNNWIDPAELKGRMLELYDGCMRGRILYVIPFSMGPIGSDIARIGIEITDSIYVVINMHMMTRVSIEVLEILGEDGEFIPCMHSVGKPLAEGETDGGLWPCAEMKDKYISHFPETREIWSYGSGYGGNALLGKKCLALRIASVIARDEGWLAEHMLILKLTNPEGRVKYVTGAFPSACGKTNLSMLVPTIPGWKVETIGDDIAWMKFGEDGRLYAINPEFGFFGVAPGTSEQSNPSAMRSFDRDAIFTNVALTQDNDVWWEDIGYDPPGKLIDWKGNEWEQGQAETPAAHPNARFTAFASNCPVMAEEWEDPRGVPISAFLFGGRRAGVIPIVHQSFDWRHGVFMGSIVGSEITAAALDLKAGAIRRDPFAMKPFCGYHIGDYVRHWFGIGEKTSPENLPKIFFVNWFRKSREGAWLWPGFGENSRILKWIFERCDDEGKGIKTPIGFMPTPDSIDLTGLEDRVSKQDMEELLAVDTEAWLEECRLTEEYYRTFGEKLPKELSNQLAALRDRLKN